GAACKRTPGTPLTACGSAIASAPLTPGEREALELSAGSLVLVQGGYARVIDLTAAPSEDPAIWLDVSDWQLLNTVSLGSPPARPHVVAEAQPFDSRARMPDVPKEDPERAMIVHALREAAQGRGVGA